MIIPWADAFMTWRKAPVIARIHLYFYLAPMYSLEICLPLSRQPRPALLQDGRIVLRRQGERFKRGSNMMPIFPQNAILLLPRRGRDRTIPDASCHFYEKPFP